MCLIYILQLTAQEISFLESLEELGQRTNSTFSYDPDLIKNVLIANELNSIEELTELLRNSA
ncbi:MAG: hypothetical protein AAF391_11785, partial [Bacteroidota bacterium]